MKKITLLLLLLLGMFQGQGQVLIGNGTTLKNLPINPYYVYSYSQSIYTAAEINANGSINSISWYYGGPIGNNIPNSSQDLKVYLGHTTKSEFASGTDWEATTNLTEVYSGSISVNGQGWVSVTFATPFPYNGTDNLVVATAELQSGHDNNNDSFLSQEATGNRSLVYQNDVTSPNLAAPQEGGLVNFLPNIIFGGIQKACPTPFFLNTIMTTFNSSMVVWGNPSPDGTSQYYLSEENIAPTSDTAPTGDSGPFAMLNNLDADTVYYIWIRNICGGNAADWSYSTSFRTECNPATTFTENFDTTAANALPSCWSSIIRGNGVSTFASVGTVVGDAVTGLNSVKLVNADTPNTADIILVAPKLSNLASGNHQLRFFADGTAVNELVVGTLNNATANATFTPLPTVGTVATTASYAEYTVNFSSYTGSDTYIGIKLNSTTNYNAINLDNIRWEAIPACTDVTGIVVENIQQETATVSWSSGDETEWEVVYDTASGITNPALLTSFEATTSSLELTDLTADTPYNVWVRSVCEGGVGAWAGPIPFRTACFAIADFSENFDTTTTPSLPACWSTIIRGEQPGQYVNIATGTANNESAPNAVLLTPGSYVTLDTTNDVILVTPNVNTLETATHRLRFSVKGNGNLQIGTLDNTTNTAIFTPLEGITVTNNYEEHIVDFTGFGGTDTYIGFRINNAATYSYTYLDNVKWELAPSCPDVVNIVLEGVTANSATLSWEEDGPESSWDVVYGDPLTTDANTLTPVLTTETTTIEIPNLDDYTSYAAWVRSDCGSEKGAWIGPILFKTDCVAVDSITENFNSVATPALPSCWSSIIKGTSSPNAGLVRSTTSNAHGEGQAIELYSQNQTDLTDVILVSPNLSNLGAGTHRLRFFATHYYLSSIEVGTLDKNTPNAVFTVIEEITLTSTHTEYIIDFTQWEGITDQYIGIRLSHNGTNSYAYIDDFVWEVAPLCPSVETVAITDITTETAFVTWEMGELLSDNWEISYATADITDANAGTIDETAATMEYSLESLTADTEYNVWIRSLCADTEGEWVGPKTFRTKCVAGTAFDENFDATTGNVLPTCWSRIVRGDSFAENFASVMVTTINPNSGTKAVSMFNSTNNNGNDIMLISPPMENLATGTHQLSFYLKGNTGGIQVVTLDDNTASDADFTVFATVPATDTYTKHTIDFSDYSGTDMYIGIRHGGVNNTTIYVDDIVWEPIITEICPAVAEVNENFDTTEVNAVPECWTTILRGPSENDIDFIGVKPNDGFGAPNSINVFKGMSGVQDEQILVLPKLSNLSAGTHQLAFSHAGPPCQIEVGTLSDNTDTAVFTLKETVTVTGDWIQTIVDFANYTGTDTYIGLRLNGGESPFVSMFIDNVIWSSDLGNDVFDNSKFSYFPNPVKNILNLSYDQNITNLEVYNVLGQKIISKKMDTNQPQVDLSELASGTYIVKVVATNATKVVKIIKE
ncbi:T9SS-dependent choice-of-anchor J family protein [Flavobacterium soli]|uniref:T9SS-dependent choice-of-anchor J family protein n=1 Tax=Flavobacterium soli TaxID=344881 RepID=UPI000551E9C6|nr:choice-of-anchor J domain-containing protein [Flavobacterium soli]